MVAEQPAKAEAGRPAEPGPGASATSEAAVESLTFHVVLGIAQDLFAVGADEPMAWARRAPPPSPKHVDATWHFDETLL